MLTGKIVLRQENKIPQVGDICKSRYISLFQWTEKHDSLDVINNLQEYLFTQVLTPYIVSAEPTKASELKKGDYILTPNDGLKKVGKTGKSNVILGENPMQFWYAEDVQRVLATPDKFAKVVITVHDDSDMPCGTEYRDILVQQIARILEDDSDVMVMSDGKGKPHLYENKVVLAY